MSADLILACHELEWASDLTPRPGSGVTLEIVHHSAGPVDQTLEQIHGEHLALGWAGVGYHIVIYADGTPHQGRPVGFVPAAAEGENEVSVDVCLLGNFERGDAGYTGPPTQAQIDTLKAISLTLHQMFPSIIETIPHKVAGALARPAYKTACCGSDLIALLPEVKQYVLDHR